MNPLLAFEIALGAVVLIWLSFRFGLVTVAHTIGPVTDDFDPGKWNSTNSRGEYLFRKAMVDSLVEDHLRNGMTYDEVVALIGPPTKPLGYNRETESSGAYGSFHISYNLVALQQEPAEPGTEEVLVIGFGDDRPGATVVNVVVS